jgi:alkanesulfonate monooxygenase SsuD/methylene tetrahydromethanopterin reductase-like flavin-dependent oxidoreductase (luciferase family)
MIVDTDQRPQTLVREGGPMRHGVVILPDATWAAAASRWQLAEQLGFDHAWTFDHLMWRWLREKPWFSTVPTLTAAAAATDRIRLGTLVATPNFRHPITFAKEIMTLDDISGGRVVCGLGAGAPGFDAEVFGEPSLAASDRRDRFLEFVELMDRLLRSKETSHRGRYYTACEARMHPGCVQQPRVPFAIAATGPAGMRLAARTAQAWITVGVSGSFEPRRFDQLVGVISDQVKRLEDACAAVGRDPASIDRIVVAGAEIGGVLESHDSFLEARGRFASIGFTDLVVFWPRPEFPFDAPADALYDIAPLLHDGPSAPRQIAGPARPQPPRVGNLGDGRI